MGNTLIPIKEFRQREPYLGSEQAIRRLIREGTLPIDVRIGRKVFVDPAKWEAFRNSGGQALPGGWRREPA